MYFLPHNFCYSVSAACHSCGAFLLGINSWKGQAWGIMFKFRVWFSRLFWEKLPSKILEQELIYHLTLSSLGQHHEKQIQFYDTVNKIKLFWNWDFTSSPPPLALIWFLPKASLDIIARCTSSNSLDYSQRICYFWVRFLSLNIHAYLMPFYSPFLEIPQIEFKEGHMAWEITLQKAWTFTFALKAQY